MKILFVAMSTSIHTARWINQISDQGWDLHLLNSNAVWKDAPHPSLQNITFHGTWNTDHPACEGQGVESKGYWPLPKGAGIARQLLAGLLPVRYDRIRKLARLIDELQPDIVHAMEFQHAGYLVLEARALMKTKMPPWILSNWGSDISHFGNLRNHAPRVRALLAACDYYSCECQRDVGLARKFGFRGEVLQPIFPCAGGYDLDKLRQYRQPGPTSGRRVIAVKGYQTEQGRALNALRGVERCADLLRDYRIVIYSMTPEVRVASELLAKSTGLDIYQKEYTSDHEEILRLHGRSRISIGSSISDGCSTSFLEAFSMGSFPIQSNTSAADEWIEDGQTGFLIHPNDSDSIAAAIRRAVTDDALVDRAAEKNWQVALKRLDHQTLRQHAIRWYREIQSKGRDAAPATLALAPSSFGEHPESQSKVRRVAPPSGFSGVVTVPEFHPIA